jgi:hypothetical protein
MLHDNVRQRTAANTTESLHQLKFEVLKHSAYSPELVPFHDRLFDSFEDASRGRHFAGG